MTEKKLSPNMPPSGGLAYQQTVEQVLAHTQSQVSGLDRAEAQARPQHRRGRRAFENLRPQRLAGEKRQAGLAALSRAF